MAIQFFDMFAGIGGFRSGLEAVGGYKCIGHCEIDKYANQAYNAIYNPKGELYFEDAKTINPNDLPDIDLICAGFPCQSFSVAGKRLGFADDTRGTLFFEVARIAEAKRPAYLSGRLSEEQNPKVRKIIKKDIDFLDHIQMEMATARQFLFIARLKDRKEKQTFEAANRIEKTISEQGFEVHRMKKADIKRFLALYFEASMNGEQMPDIDGEQFYEVDDEASED